MGPAPIRGQLVYSFARSCFVHIKLFQRLSSTGGEAKLQLGGRTYLRKFFLVKSMFCIVLFYSPFCWADLLEAQSILLPSKGLIYKFNDKH